MRLLFAGTPEIALPSLVALGRDHDICGVLTNPDREAGRGKRMLPSPVKEKALELGLEVLQPDRLGAAARDEVVRLAPELLVVVAYGRIFGPKFLALFPRGGVNLHPSLLPRWRGPAPITACILAGESTTGISVQRLALEMDAGDILLQEELVLTGRETTESLTERAGREGAHLLVECCRVLERIKPRPQDPGSATYSRIVTKDDGLIDWSLGSDTIERMVRAYVPWPHARTSWAGDVLHLLEAEPWKEEAPNVGDAQVVSPAASLPGTVLGIDKRKGIAIQTGHGVLAVQTLQLQSKRPLCWKDFVNGAHGFIGATLGG